MTVNFRKFGVLASVFLLGSIPGQSHAQMGSLVVKVDQPGVKISSTFNGLMIEDINHSIDGGLYAELIQNRVFRDNPDNPVHWSLVQTGEGAGTIGLDSSQPVPGTVLTSSLRIEVSKSRVGSRVGVANDGYWGIPCLPGERYRATFYAKAAPGFIGPLTLSLESADGLHVWASSQSPAPGLGWKQYSVILKTKKDAPISATNRFVISTNSPGTIWLTQVSLMPQTYHNRPNGTRVDLMQKLAGIQPKFLRFPGGNYLEGDTIVDRFDWKKMIGDIAQRPGHPDSWGYRSNDGFGLLEYLEWCEDLQMQPVVGIYAGFSLDRKHVPPGPDLAPYVQDALDEIEYITGDVHSKWGARRIADGHLAPFPLTYVEIGNEDWGDTSGSYSGRYAQFYDAIKAKYPKLQIIASTQVQGHLMDVLDEHFYRSPAEMEHDSGHFDSYSRSGPKIFVGEWASLLGSYVPDQNSATLNPTSSMEMALGDAAWLTGLERNSDLVVMEAYAPLLVNVNPHAWQWGINLIGFDAARSFGSPSYYVQSIFAANTGDVTLPLTLQPPKYPSTFFAAASRDTRTGDILLKVVNTGSTVEGLQIQLMGARDVAKTAVATVLSGELADRNSVENPLQISPRTTTVSGIGSAFVYEFPAYSVTVLRLKARK